jgi:hypothetical protein
MAAAAKNAIAVDALTVVVLANRSTNNQGDGMFFDQSAFLYQPESDSYTCPAGRKLVRKQFMRRGNCILYPGEYCSGCALKPRCTSAERRLLTRHFHEEALKRLNARLEADPDLMRQRRCAARNQSHLGRVTLRRCNPTSLKKLLQLTNGASGDKLKKKSC